MENILSNTGPLISIFQSASTDIIAALFERVIISSACAAELIRHGWEEELHRNTTIITQVGLNEQEKLRSMEIAQRIASHPQSRDTNLDNHIGESEVIVLAARDEFANHLLLLDELAARAVALEVGVKISGFAGVLLLAVSEGLLSPEDVRDRLLLCQQQGTHYSDVFIDQIYRAAKDGES